MSAATRGRGHRARAPWATFSLRTSWRKAASALPMITIAVAAAFGSVSVQAALAPTLVDAACNGWPSSSGVPPTGHDFRDFSSGSSTWSNGDLKVKLPSTYTCSSWQRTWTYNGMSTGTGAHWAWIRSMTVAGGTTNCNYAGSGTTDYMRQDGCGNASFSVRSGAGISQNTTYTNFGVGYASCSTDYGATGHYDPWDSHAAPGVNCGTPATRIPDGSPPKFDWTAPASPTLTITAGSHAALVGSTLYVDGLLASSSTVAASGSTDTGGSGFANYSQALSGSTGGWTPTSSTTASQVYSWTAALTDGQTATLTVTAKDVAGNSSATVTRTFVADDVAPTVSFTDPGQPLIVQKLTTYTTKISVADPGALASGVASWSLRREWSPATNDTCGTTWTNEGTVASGTAAVTGQLTAQSGLVDGRGYHWIITAADKVGHVTTSLPSGCLVVDATPPAAPSTPDLDAASDTGASSTDNVTSDTTPTFVGTAEANASVTIYDGTTSVGNAAATGAGAYSVTTTPLSPGVHAVTAKATDVVGNQSGSSAALQVTIAVTQVGVTWPTANAVLFGTENLGASATGDPISTVDFLVDGIQVGSSTTAPYQLSYDTTSAAQGVHSAQAVAHLAAGGTVASPTTSFSVDNTLPTTARLTTDFASSHLTLDDYSLDGVYAVAAPALLPTRYQSASADAQSDNHALDYLQHWSSLTSATQNSIAAVLDQPYRGTFYATHKMPATRTPTQLPANPDPCDHVGQLLGFATVDECHHDTQHFTISYFLNGTLSWAPDNVTGGFDPSGVPTLIDRYAAALEAAYTVYSSSLGYPTNWTGLVPAEVHSLCGGCGQVLPQGFNAGSPWDTVQTIELSQDVNTAADYLAHHELFHVFQYQYWTFPFRVQLPLHFFEVRWLMESTADWAAGYVTRSGVPGDATAYTQALPTFLGRTTDAIDRFDDNAGLGRQYGASIFDEYLVEKLDATTNPGVIKEIWERISANPDNPVAAIDAVAVAHGKSLSSLLPDFWKANYLLAYNDAIGSGNSDVETAWRPQLQSAQDPATHGDGFGPARPARQHVDLQDGVQASGDATVDRGGARYIELQPSRVGIYGDFAIAISGAARPDLQVRVITLTYPPGNPPAAATVCGDQPVALQNGSGSITVPLTPTCTYVLLVVASTDASGSGDTAHWTATFSRKTVVATNPQWKTLELSWSGGTTNPEPSGWQSVGFVDSSWSAAYIPTDPYFSWVDIPDADWLSSTGRATSHLQSEVWIARYQFTIDGSVPSDATMQWNADNTASIWINGTQLVTNGGTWSSITSTTIPKALLHSGTNSIGVKVFQDSNTNTWSVNPTFFQTSVTIPTQ